MTYTFAFDIYGTVVDTAGVHTVLTEFVGDKAGAFTALWRTKQLEYSFRRGLMREYVDFSVCTREALEYASLFLKTPLSRAQKDSLMHVYTILPAFDDTVKGLDMLKENGHRVFAFSNGSREAIVRLLKHNGILPHFDGVVSVEEVASFKPDPTVYTHFNVVTDSVPKESWLVSSNPFDVTGALAYGMRSAWVRRSEENVFDPWEYSPTMIVSSIVELAGELP